MMGGHDEHNDWASVSRDAPPTAKGWMQAHRIP